MRTKNSTRSKLAGRRGAEGGYALLVVVFLAAVMVIVAATAAPSLLTQGKRELEEDMIWRGEQYARAVRLFYRKNGRFPQTLDDLTKPQNNIRYMRQAYKDPMNKEDGSWRMIYVGPSGELVGSLTRVRAVQIAGATPAAALATGIQPGFPGTTMGPGGSSPRPGQPLPGGPLGGILPSGGMGQPQTGTPQQGSGTPQPAGIGPATRTDSEGRILGGNIIGVGSKVRKASVRIYKGGETYRMWEFIWDPVAEAAAAASPGAAAPGTPSGTSGTGTPQMISPPATRRP